MSVHRFGKYAYVSLKSPLRNYFEAFYQQKYAVLKIPSCKDFDPLVQQNKYIAA